jgi:hypothetical protein
VLAPGVVVAPRRQYRAPAEVEDEPFGFVDGLPIDRPLSVGYRTANSVHKIIDHRRVPLVRFLSYFGPPHRVQSGSRCCTLGSHCPHSSSVGESSLATRTLAVASLEERRERRRLRRRHDCLEGQRGSVGVVAIGDAADRMAENLDRRLGNVLVVVGRARLAQILQLPRPLFTGFDVRSRLDAGEGRRALGGEGSGVALRSGMKPLQPISGVPVKCVWRSFGRTSAGDSLFSKTITCW